MTSKRSKNETKQNKEIFIERLVNEAVDTSFLGVVKGSKSEILNILQSNDNLSYVIACPVRVTDTNCRNKNPAYGITKGYFKPTDTTYFKSQRQNWIIDAIRTTFLDYDPNIQYDHGDIRKMVWYRYRQARRYVREEDLRRKREKRQKREAAEREMRRIAAGSELKRKINSI